MDDRSTAPVVYLDANPFIYAVEGIGDDAAAMRDLLARLRDRPGAAVTSELTLAEVLAPSSTGVSRPPDVKRLYMDLLVWGDFVRLYPVSREVLYETAKVRTAARMKLPDAIHLCTAIRNQCRYFLSRDSGISVPSTMKLARPDTEAARAVAEALS